MSRCLFVVVVYTDSRDGNIVKIGLADDAITIKAVPGPSEPGQPVTNTHGGRPEARTLETLDDVEEIEPDEFRPPA